MSYQAHVTDVAYCYDGSFAGFLCCVFESYARREIPAEVCPPEEGQLNFFGARDIPTDPQRVLLAHYEKDKAGAAALLRDLRAVAAAGLQGSPHAPVQGQQAQRTLRLAEAAIQRLGAQVKDCITTGFLSTEAGKDLTLLRFARLCFEQGPRAAQMLGNPDAAAAFALARAVSNEACKCIEFIRFEQRDDMLGAVIHPKHQVLPLLRGHFCSRLPDDDFLIFDAAHGTALVRRSGRVQYLTMERYTPGTDAGELDWQRLWKRFFKALTIEERRNEKAQMNHVQKRFWKDMVEMQGDLPSSLE